MYKFKKNIKRVLDVSCIHLYLFIMDLICHMKLFDIKLRTLGYIFYQPLKKPLLKSFYHKKIHLKISNPQSPKIANFKPSKRLCTSP